MWGNKPVYLRIHLYTKFWIIGICAAGVALVGCGPQPTELGFNGADATKPVKILRNKSGSHAALPDHGLWLINSDEQLEALDAEVLFDLNVDFETESLVLVTLGRQPTGGHWIKITAVSRASGALYIHGWANRPGPDQVTIQIRTFPYAAAVISKIQAATLHPEIDSTNTY